MLTLSFPFFIRYSYLFHQDGTSLSVFRSLDVIVLYFNVVDNNVGDSITKHIKRLKCSNNFLNETIKFIRKKSMLLNSTF